jgi:hypothetical protein
MRRSSGKGSFQNEEKEIKQTIGVGSCAIKTPACYRLFPEVSPLVITPPHASKWRRLKSSLLVITATLACLLGTVIRRGE